MVAISPGTEGGLVLDAGFPQAEQKRTFGVDSSVPQKEQ